MNPESEWKFDKVPKDEIEACFWWEYIRTGLDESLRSELSKQWHTAPETIHNGPFFVGGSVRRRFVVPSVLMHFTCLDDVFLTEEHPKQHWKQAGDFFLERRAWMDLPQALRRRLVGGFPSSAYAAFVDTVAAQRRGFEATIKADGLERALSWFDDKPIVYETKDGIGKERVVGSVLRVRVDWRFTDAEILQEFGNSLHNLRPREWPERTRPYRRLLYPDFFRPSTHRAALGWLGVLRLNKAGCAWGRFGDVYRIKTEEADLRKQARWAKAIIAWMTDGDRSHLDCLPAVKTRLRRAKS